MKIQRPQTTIRRILCGLLFMWIAPLMGFAQNSPKPDQLLVHGNVVTMNPAKPSAQAIAIAGERIAWVGSDKEAYKLFPSAGILDLQGATVLPGILDAHPRSRDLGTRLLRLNLKDVATEEEAVARVRQKVAVAGPGEWILGWGWDEGKWASHYPDNNTLSQASPENPVFLVGLHSFASWANKKALAVAGI